MKDILIGAALFAASFMVLFQLALLGVIFKPELFAPAHHADTPVVAESSPDSLQMDTTDSITTEKNLQREAATKTDLRPDGDSAALALQRRLLTVGAPVEVKNLGTKKQDQPADTLTHADSVRIADLKSKAKLLESMDPETAAKILGNLDEEDIKIILMSIKKRQAGKILGSMDPGRASKILR